MPLLKESAESSKMVPDAFLSADYPEAAQAEAARFLAEYEGFDFDRGSTGTQRPSVYDESAQS